MNEAQKIELVMKAAEFGSLMLHYHEHLSRQLMLDGSKLILNLITELEKLP